METEDISRAWCPGCEPARDPSREILQTRWCEAHEPSRAGLDDAAVRSDADLSGSAEAGGAQNRAFAAMLRESPRRQR